MWKKTHIDSQPTQVLRPAHYPAPSISSQYRPHSGDKKYRARSERRPHSQWAGMGALGRILWTKAVNNPALECVLVNGVIAVGAVPCCFVSCCWSVCLFLVSDGLFFSVFFFVYFIFCYCCSSVFFLVSFILFISYCCFFLCLILITFSLVIIVYVYGLYSYTTVNLVKSLMHCYIFDINFKESSLSHSFLCHIVFFLSLYIYFSKTFLILCISLSIYHTHLYAIYHVIVGSIYYV